MLDTNKQDFRFGWIHAHDGDAYLVHLWRRGVKYYAQLEDVTTRDAPIAVAHSDLALVRYCDPQAIVEMDRCIASRLA